MSSQIQLQNLTKEEIINFYHSEFSKYTQDFPLDSEQLYSHHKSILSLIKNKYNIESFSSMIEKEINIEY